MQCVERCDDPNPANHVVYEQPVWQSLNMFIGELGCTYRFHFHNHPILPIATRTLLSLQRTAFHPELAESSF